MRVFAISDLHLSSEGKTMDVFGEHWRDHFSKIKSDWLKNVSADDAVVIAGDISWAMKLDEAASDLKEICSLPGKKVMIKGNHDFWHSSLSKTRALLYNETYFLQNDAVEIGDFVFAGSRGWKQPSDADFSDADKKIYDHEILRLKMSLEKVCSEKRLIGIMHYPPFSAGRQETEFTRLFCGSGAEAVVYGHIHGKALRSPDFADFSIGGTRFIETSCDHLDFRLKLIAEG